MLLAMREGRKPKIADLFSEMRLFLPLLGFGVLAMLAISLGFTLLVVPGFLVTGFHNGNGSCYWLICSVTLGEITICRQRYLEIFSFDKLADNEKKDYQQKNDIDDRRHIKTA